MFEIMLACFSLHFNFEDSCYAVLVACSRTVALRCVLQQVLLCLGHRSSRPCNRALGPHYGPLLPHHACNIFELQHSIEHLVNAVLFCRTQCVFSSMACSFLLAISRQEPARC